MILSDRSIREALAAGRIEIDPLGTDAVQPASVDVRLDDGFRVFANHRHPVIDVRQPMPDLTELVTASNDEPFVLHPGEFVLASTYERLRLPADLVARIEGKALALTTEVPTPAGWRLMGDLAVGDLVFDERGAPVRIAAATPPLLDRPCRAVVMRGGERIIADDQHRWWVQTRTDRQRGSTRLLTTAALSPVKVGTEYRHHVPLADPVQYPERTLPIDPYVLGIWLGDGTSTAAMVTTVDAEVLEEIVLAGYRVERRGRMLSRIGGAGHTRSSATGRYEPNTSLNSELRKQGLLGNKHVPEPYLQSSIEQRTSLLQGLMDSDGYVDEYGRCEFCSTNPRLAAAVRELAASLGLKPYRTESRAKLYGRDCGPKYLVKFTSDRPVFRLRRKLDRLKSAGLHGRSRAIVAVEQTPSVPVRCIEVASPSGLFLVSRSFVPTHNSSLGRLGLLTHATAGFVDPGWDGWLTLELSNVATLPIALYPGMKIGQLAFFELTTPAEHPYGSQALGSKYQGQRGPTASRYFQNYEAGGSVGNAGPPST